MVKKYMYFHGICMKSFKSYLKYLQINETLLFLACKFLQNLEVVSILNLTLEYVRICL